MKTATKSNQPKVNARTDPDVYQMVQAIFIKDLTTKLETMIASADTVDGWKLSVKDGTRLIKFLNLRKPIIQSSFTLLLKQHFSGFKSGAKPLIDVSIIKDHRSLKLTDAELAAENHAIQRMITSAEKTHHTFYARSYRQLQQRVPHKQANERDNPLHVAGLCEAFQYSINTLSISNKFQVAVYYLFSQFIIDHLGSTYEKVNRYLSQKNASTNGQIKAVATPETSSKTQTKAQSNLHNIKVKKSNPNVKKPISAGVKTKSVKASQSAQQATTEKTKANPATKPNLLESTGNTPLFATITNQAASIRKGDWAEIRHDRGMQLGKLTWKAPDYSLFIFVDDQGKRIKELSGTELNKALDDSSIRLVADFVVTNKVHYRVM